MSAVNEPSRDELEIGAALADLLKVRAWWGRRRLQRAWERLYNVEAGMFNARQPLLFGEGEAAEEEQT